MGAERGRPRVIQNAASGIKPDRHIIKGLRLRISPICTLSQNGYGDPGRRRLYIGCGGGLARDSHKPFLDYMRLSMCVLCVCVRMCCVCSLYESLIDF